MPGIIDGSRWLEARIKHLETALAGDLTDDQRVLVETELAQLRAEVKGGRRRLRRWLLFGGPRRP